MSAKSENRLRNFRRTKMRGVWAVARRGPGKGEPAPMPDRARWRNAFAGEYGRSRREVNRLAADTNRDLGIGNVFCWGQVGRVILFVSASIRVDPRHPRKLLIHGISEGNDGRAETQRRRDRDRPSRGGFQRVRRVARPRPCFRQREKGAVKPRPYTQLDDSGLAGQIGNLRTEVRGRIKSGTSVQKTKGGGERA